MISQPLWTVTEILAVTGGTSVGRFEVDGLAIDSREVIPGDLFIALDGPNTDGHAYVNEALAAGAVGALVSRDCSDVAGDDPRLIHVPDSYDALLALAKAARTRMTGPVLAVTGSAGKTSVKEALRLALGRSGQVHASIRSFNNHVGVPLSLARMPREATCAVFELGMSGPCEIEKLSRLVRPAVVVITSVGAAHLATFDDIEAIADAKAEIFKGLAPNGTAILNMDHDYAGRLLSHAQKAGVNVVRVSLEDEMADAYPVRLAMAQNNSCMTARLGERLVTCKIGAPGRHWVSNALMVLAAVGAMDGDVGLAALALADMQPPAGRGRRHDIALRDGMFVLIDDAYNANPLSLSAALSGLAGIVPERKGHKLAVLSDMADLGPTARDLHLALLPEMEMAGLSDVIALGEHITALVKAAGISCHKAQTPKEAVCLLRQMVRPDDVVLVKGSNRAGLQILVVDFVSHGAAGSGARSHEHIAAKQERIACCTIS